MQKYKNLAIGILAILCIYFLFSQFYLKQFGSYYTYVINPLFFAVIALITKFSITSPYTNRRFKKNIIQYVCITVLIYAILYLSSGLFLTYGKNPYSSTILGIVFNLYSTGFVIFCREYIRYKLINSVLKKEQKLIFIFIVVTFAFQDINISSLLESINIYYLFKITFNTIMPSAIKNVLFTYICQYCDFTPPLIYEFFWHMILWIPPVLPNAPWIFDSILNSVFPLILFLYCRYEISLKDKLHLYKYSKPIEPKGTIPLVAGIVLLIWFTIGIFPIKPIGVASGSMEPYISIGDLVIIQKCNSNDIQIDDIIEYSMKDYSVIHRVVKKYQENGSTYFITKGDSNSNVDSDPVTEDMLKGKVIFKIPYLAWPTIWVGRLSGRQQNVDVETGY
ncbi:MAG: signal peptidase I [Clostridia bacterium]|nr:signal peptidase I [Clostridia bacterium]